MAKVELKDRKNLNIKIGSLDVKLIEGKNEIDLTESEIERIVTHLGRNKNFNELIKLDGKTLKTRLKDYENQNEKK